MNNSCCVLYVQLIAFGDRGGQFVSYICFPQARASAGSPRQEASRCRTPPGADTRSQSAPWWQRQFSLTKQPLLQPGDMEGRQRLCRQEEKCQIKWKRFTSSIKKKQDICFGDSKLEAEFLLATRFKVLSMRPV